MSQDPRAHFVEPDDALEPTSLEQLPDTLKDAAKRAGWTKLMPVQERTIPYVLEGRDLLIQSRTGTGKTGAFILPIMAKIDPEVKACQALILVPTRELARQVTEQVEILSGDSGISSVAVYGGVGYGPQNRAFREGVQIVVGTPGRILDHLLRGNLTLNQLQFLVFDEADRMLSMGFYPDMREVQTYLPDRPIQGYMFSATFPARVHSLASQFLTKPGFLSLSSDNVLVAETEHVVYIAKTGDKDRALVRVLEVENPESALIFCNTKDKVHYVSTVLRRFGYDADELSADISQNERERVMTRLRARNLRFLVATDVAERGIDIQDLSHVIHYEVPDDPETYVHRSGRTGRAGARGMVITLVDVREKMSLTRIRQKFRIPMVEKTVPTEEEMARIVGQRATAMLEARRRNRGNLMVERMQRFKPLARELAQDEDSLELLAMLIDDVYHQTTHAPKQDLYEPVEPKERELTPKNQHGGGRGRGRRSKNRR